MADKESAANEADEPTEKDISEPPEKIEPANSPSATPPGRVVRLSTLVTASVGLLLVALAATLGFLLVKARGELSHRDALAADQQHAERVATDYAVGAATINYQDLPAWITKLKSNTAPAMSSKFDATAPKLQQILLPLKWVSNATPIAAKVESANGSIYKVDVFVSVNSTTAQTPDGTQTTVTYNVTIDKESGWKITDVGGTMAALTPK
ncbi:hypothetical protein [Mycobacteroides abscessus]|uniref:hypothetical protein n=1 Tax=Mycobacteroides abscessus TaxID=36809 RepID=UPI00078C7F5C|nr:hypothetical protein [Mycobacteroides abscessus]AMU75760.1 hypothetical protein A3O06_14880 [Mycobacteroides abscessus]ANO24705.1 hypothetical protein BAB79_14875 [Mycobacteroides abscessus]